MSGLVLADVDRRPSVTLMPAGPKSPRRALERSRIGGGAGEPRGRCHPERGSEATESKNLGGGTEPCRDSPHPDPSASLSAYLRMTIAAVGANGGFVEDYVLVGVVGPATSDGRAGGLGRESRAPSPFFR
jgi:hypothetical protein